MPLFQNGYSQYIFQTGTTEDTQTKIVYISSVSGNDSTGEIYLAEDFADEADALDPSFTPNAFETCIGAIEYVRSQYANSVGWSTGSFWFLIERGTECNADDRIVSPSNYGAFPFQGVNEEHRVIVGAWGDSSLPRPIVKYFVNGSNSMYFAADPGYNDYITVKNIHFYCTARDPSHPDYDTNKLSTIMTPVICYYGNDRPGVDNLIIIEDCEFSYYAGAMALQGTDNKICDGLVINRNKIHHIFGSTTEFSSGIFASNTRGLKLIENVLHMIGHNRDTPTTYGTQFNQGLYMGNNYNLQIVGNLVNNVSHAGIQCRRNSTHEIYSNVVMNCAYGISMGHAQNEYDKNFAEVYRAALAHVGEAPGLRRARCRAVRREEDRGVRDGLQGLLRDCQAGAGTCSPPYTRRRVRRDSHEQQRLVRTEGTLVSDLTAKTRNGLRSSAFGLPKSRKYPMPDRSHAVNAKARATQMVKAGKLSSSQASQIRAKANRILGSK
jgi:hypothetical protein